MSFEIDEPSSRELFGEGGEQMRLNNLHRTPAQENTLSPISPDPARPKSNENVADLAVRISALSKCYQIYGTPRDRLKQFVLPRVQRFLGKDQQRYFREFWALKDISVQIRKGETVGIIGRNGSGKSTLLQIICGINHPSVGDVEVNGRVAALLELGSGFNPEFTGRENVFMNAGILGLSRGITEERFPEIEAFADIGDFIDQPVKTYSSGMMVRLAFAVIAHVSADILIIDEALAVGDAFFTQKCMRFLREFMKSGTVLFVSHDTGAIKGLCNRAIWLDRGKVQQEGDPKEICDMYLKAFYEAQQGASEKKTKTIKNIPKGCAAKDQRLELINRSTLRNDIKLFRFNAEAESFGKGDAEITNVEFLDTENAPLAWVVGGERVKLRIDAVAHEPLQAPIIGFFIKDRLGQFLFGDNTYLSYVMHPIACERDQQIRAEFEFQMPILPAGDYAVNVAIADGAQDDHVQHHWIYDAVLFRSESSSVVTGLVGIPMDHITLDVLEG